MLALAGADVRRPHEWRADAAELLARAGSVLPSDARRAARRFVEGPAPVAAFRWVTPRFTHNDLGIEHVLVSPSGEEVLGSIDWSDAAVTDPAVDFARILRDLDPGALEAAHEAYGRSGDGDPALGERVWHLARCLVLEDLAFGVDTDAAPYVAKSLEAAGWLFSA
jgi:aminoglycoside phosphotransferase (APT) family kinase protein